jgi:hypothetical protein
MMSDSTLQELTAETVDGDLTAFRALLEQPPARVEALKDSLSDLVVTKEGLLRVLVAFQRQAVLGDLVQQWASFVCRGYFGSSVEPRQPLDISYDDSAEQEIVKVVSRLDELGDLADGEISGDELATMIGTLQSEGMA